jgi:leucyl/phenylalanyl-tRNA--protein transferase
MRASIIPEGRGWGGDMRLEKLGVEPAPGVHAAADARHSTLFTESATERMQRWILGTAWALRPCRIAGLPALGRMWLGELVRPNRALPRPEDALSNPPGLCGMVHDLSVDTLTEAHRRGLFTFAHFGPLKWMAPPERCVLNFADFHMSKRLRSRLRQNRYRVTFDQDFDAVIKACAGRRDGKWHLTWITPQIMQAYRDLHDAGYAHSFEVWNSDGALVGGGYGVAVGGAFTIESQFTRESHTSKIGFAMLNWHLAKWGFLLNDNKGPTQNTLEMGFELVPRAEYQARLAQAMALPDRRGKWEIETDLATVAQWNPSTDERRAPPLQPAMRPLAPVGALLVPVVGAIGHERLAFAEAFCAML